MISQKIKVILAESQELMRESLTTLLKTKPFIDLVAEVATGKMLVEILKHKHADVILLDTDLAHTDAKSTFEVLKKRFPETKVILLSPPQDLHLMPEYMTKGANCFLSKTCSVETLLKAIQTVQEEGFFFDNAASKIMLESFIKVKSRQIIPADTNFSDRETEIVKLICDGKTNKEIANSLYLSSSTVDFHRSRIYSKTKCSNVAQLFRFALKKGIVELT